MHAMFAAYISGSLLSIQGQYGLHMFDIQRVEQDNGVLECIHSAREMPSILGSLRCSLRCNDDPIYHSWDEVRM